MENSRTMGSKLKKLSRKSLVHNLVSTQNISWKTYRSPWKLSFIVMFAHRLRNALTPDPRHFGYRVPPKGWTWNKVKIFVRHRSARSHSFSIWLFQHWVCCHGLCSPNLSNSRDNRSCAWLPHACAKEPSCALPPCICILRLVIIGSCWQSRQSNPFNKGKLHCARFRTPLMFITSSWDETIDSSSVYIYFFFGVPSYILSETWFPEHTYRSLEYLSEVRCNAFSCLAVGV